MLNAGVPWLRGTTGALCFICKEGLDVNHFLWECKVFRENFQSVWFNIFQEIDSANPTDGLQISSCLFSSVEEWRSADVCHEASANVTKQVLVTSSLHYTVIVGFFQDWPQYEHDTRKA